jgi:glycine amidinotransferase
MHGPRSQESVEKANIQLNNLAKILEERGIRVDRPTPLDFNQEIGTPEWKNGSMFGCMPPRDILLTVGKEMLEATMSYRSRWFEYLCYRPLLQSYFDDDPGMKMEAAPKPRLTDASYKLGYLNDSITIEERLKMVAEKNFVTTEVEPLFDAADVIRFGKDLFVQHGFTTNLKAIDWLQRHFPDHRVHALNFPGDPYPIHIDATFTPLRPGLILNNPKRLLPKEQRKIFEINDWEIVESAQPAHDTPPPLCYSSVWLSMNVLVLDTNTVCVEASEKNMIKQIEGFGMEVIPVPFRDAYPFGGGLHCSTADVYREGDCEDYFPKQP